MQRYCEHCRKYVEARRAPFSNLLMCPVCNGEFGADYLTSGTIVSGFRIDTEIGRGSFGIVYKALQLNLERMVALKILSDELARDNDFVDNFFREARLAASLSHPNIVQAYDAGATPEGIYYFAMELIEGETLEARINRSGRIPQETAIEIALKIAKALDYAWERQKLTHGDIKPENIIINSSGEPKLADLGLAKIGNEDREGHLMVTPLYAPPEVISGVASYDPGRADIYSFGGTFYHMLSGTPPFNEDDPEKVMQMHLNDIPVSLAERVNIHPDLSFITDRMLAKNPDERPHDWQEIIHFLEAVDLRPYQMDKSTRRVPLRDLSRLTLHRHRSIIYAVIGILGIASILLMILIFILSHTVRKNLHIGPGSGPRITRDYEWNKLKNDIKFLNEQKALELVSGFVGTHKDVPAEALQTLNQLKKENDQALQREHRAANFEQTFHRVLAKLKTDNFDQMSWADLTELHKTLQKLQTQLAQEATLNERLTPEDRQLFEGQAQAVQAALTRKETEARKESLLKNHADKHNYLEKIQTQAREIAVANAEADRLVLAVAAWNGMAVKNRTAAMMKKLLSEINARQLPPDYARLYDFITEVYRNDENVNTLLVRWSPFFKGTELPAPNPCPGYRVAAVEESGIILENRLAYGVLKKKLRLHQLKSKYKCDWLFRTFTAPAGAANLNAGDCDLLLRLFLDYRDPRTPALVEKFYQLSQDRRACWKLWLHLNEKAAADAGAVTLCRQALDAFAAGRYAESVQRMDKLWRTYGSSEVVKRYADVLNHHREAAFALAPELSAEGWLPTNTPSPVRRTQEERLTWLIMLKARYDGVKALPSAVKLRLAATTEKLASALAALPSAPTPEPVLLSPWRYAPGQAWKTLTGWLQNHADAGAQTKLLQLYAWRDIGDYGAIMAAFGRDNTPVDWFVADKRFMPAAATAVTGSAILADDYGAAGMLRGNVMKLLEDLTRRAEPLSPPDFNARYCRWQWARESGLPLDSPLVVENELKQHPSTAALRLAWLDLQQLLDSPDPDLGLWRRKNETYARCFGEQPETASAAAAFRIASALLNGAESVNALVAGETKVPGDLDDAGWHLLISAAAYATVTGKLSRDQAAVLVARWETQMGDGAAWAPTWEAWLTLKLSLVDNWADFQVRVKETLNDIRLRALPLYPELIVLNQLLLQTRGWLTPAMAQAGANQMLTGCSLGGVSELVLLLGGAAPEKTLRQWLESGRLRQGYWAGVLLLVADYYDSNRAIPVASALADFRSKMTWEQRRLLDNINQLLAKLPE